MNDREVTTASGRVFLVCIECKVWDRDEGYHLPKCSRYIGPEPKPVRKVSVPRVDTYGNEFAPYTSKDGARRKREREQRQRKPQAGH